MNRLAGYLVLALALAGATAWGTFVVLDWRADARRLALVEQELVDVRARHRLELTAAQEATDEYRNELETLRSRRAAEPARPVRLCRAAVPAGSSSPAAGRPDGPAAGAGQLSGPDGPGRDVGPDLYAIADRCDELSAQLRGLQGWVGRTSGQLEP